MKPVRPVVEHRDVAVVDVSTSVAQAARIMSEREIGAVPVVDGDRMAGIFTERDILSILSRVMARQRGSCRNAGGCCDEHEPGCCRDR